MNDVKAQSQLTGMAATTAADIVTEKKAGRPNAQKTQGWIRKPPFFFSIVRYTHTHTYTKGIQTGLLDKNAAGVSLFSDQLPPTYRTKNLYALKFSLVL